MTNSNRSVSENIANILKAAPSFHAEDDEIDDTTAKVINLEQNELSFDDDGYQKSLFRLQNADLLEEVDSKYAGKRGSRKDLKAFSDSSDVEESDKDSGTDETEEVDEEDEDIIEEESEYSGDEEQTEELDDTKFQHFSKKGVENQTQKSVCVRNQMVMWEKLLEVRIQLQKCLLASNKLPIGDNFQTVKNTEREDFSKVINETTGSLINVLDKFVTLQTLVIRKYPETKRLLKSDSDAEESGSESEEAPKKKRKLDEYEEEVKEIHKKYTKYRNDVIQKWNEKSRVTTITKNNPAQNIIQQIDHILNNKDKLIKKSQLRKSDYEIIGEPNEDDETPNENIYDDDDFYHQLLRELIEFKSSDITDPVQLGRQWMQLQNLRSKMKKKIDTKATKGRKIRYAVHPKLVNFMAPMNLRSTWTDEARRELFNSLFGKNI